jgi:type III restriction enzyme
MKFTLKDYQEEAVSEVLLRLRRGRRRWHEDREVQAFSLTAPTGAGKTIMAAAVFEALFHGDDEAEADPGAVVIWFSDDPSLNEQTRFRLGEASDRLNWTNLHVVENSFNREKFSPGKVYFLNTHKLSRNSLLVRGHERGVETEPSLPDMGPDARSYTIWDTIRNTIDDPVLTLYLVLDEAHRGLGEGRTLHDRSTIVRRLINGADAVPPMPIVWGISATVERFNVAMREAQGRSILSGVAVDPVKVQESGLLKDTIVLDIPDGAGHFQTVLVRRAADKIVESSQAWADYATQQPGTPKVHPLLVVQVQNTPDPNEIGRALHTIYERWPGLSREAIAHVFGEHVTQNFGSYVVPYISPERVRESSWVRVLIAKDAISTGWDCPRAEVMVSFRAAQDPTHITQLLGRMVRTPLARRIPGNDKLNSVDCLLPFFDRAAVKAVADALMVADGNEELRLPGRRVLINPAEMMPNPSVACDVWEKFLSLPSQSLPHRAPRPIRRLTSLAHELATDGILSDAGKEAHREMHLALDAARARYVSQLDAARQTVLTVEGTALTADLRAQITRFNQFFESADMAVIEDAYRRAARAFSPDLARTYAEYLAQTMTDSDPEEALIDAHVEIAALATIDGVREYLDNEAEQLTRRWFDLYRIAIKSLSEARRGNECEARSSGHWTPA